MNATGLIPYNGSVDTRETWLHRHEAGKLSEAAPVRQEAPKRFLRIVAPSGARGRYQGSNRYVLCSDYADQGGAFAGERRVVILKRSGSLATIQSHKARYENHHVQYAVANPLFVWDVLEGKIVS